MDEGGQPGASHRTRINDFLVVRGGAPNLVHIGNQGATKDAHPGIHGGDHLVHRAHPYGMTTPTATHFDLGWGFIARAGKADVHPLLHMLLGGLVLPNTINDYLASAPFEKLSNDHPEVVAAVASATERINRLLSIQGTRSVDSFHKELGQIMWEYCGMERTEAGLKKAIELIRQLRVDYWNNVRVTGVNEDFNQALERAGRLADFMELGELMCIDALHRRESCGGHFRAESQTEEGEALRHDDEFLYVAAWEWTGEGAKPVLHREPLVYKAIELKQQSYK